MPIEIENGEEVINTNTRKKITRGKKTPDVEPETISNLEDDFGSHPDYPPYIQYSPNKDKFKCIECNKELLKQHVDRHIKAYHLIEENKDNSTETSENEVNPEKDPEIEHLNTLIADKRKTTNSEELVTPEGIVLDNINKDIADGATKIAKNIHLQFLYIETKNIFPPEWSFEDWVSFLITYSLKEWGISYGVNQDLETLSEEQLVAIREAKLSWKRVDMNG